MGREPDDLVSARRQSSGLPSSDDLLAAARASQAPGVGAWLVGGCLRDELLGLPVNDIDLVVESGVEEFSRSLAGRLDGSAYMASDAFGTWRVVVGALHVDVASLRGVAEAGEAGGSCRRLTGDLRARDFTVNAMARPLAGGALIDPLGGRDDLRARRLRLCSPCALHDDPLRVLRLARLGRGLDLAPDAMALEAASGAAPGLGGVSGERLRDELSALLALKNGASALHDLAAWGALAVVLPEVAGLGGVGQNDYHHRDVLGHTLEALAYVRGVVEQLGGGEHLASPMEAGLPCVGALVPVSWAVLLHDIGKPAARTVGDDGRIIFWHHDEIGSRMAGAIARRLRMSSRFSSYLSTLVRQHLRLGFLVREQPLTRRAVTRYRRDVSPWVFESVVVSLCDRLATRGDKTSHVSIARHYRLARSMWTTVSKAPVPRLLSGEDVMELLELPPGPAVGLALDALEEEVGSGEIATASEARAFLRDWRLAREADGRPGDCATTWEENG
jgi:tRNA nucleotidyltransferase/poly(A) polymerase